jgi:hypothetical protein
MSRAGLLPENGRIRVIHYHRTPVCRYGTREQRVVPEVIGDDHVVREAGGKFSTSTSALNTMEFFPLWNLLA